MAIMIIYTKRSKCADGHCSLTRKIWTAFFLQILISPTIGYLIFPQHHGGGHPLQYLKVIRHAHPHHAAGGRHHHVRVHPSLHGHIHYGNDYPHHSGTHYHGVHHPGHHYHNQPATLHGYQLQGAGHQAPSYQGTSEPQQNEGYYGEQNYYTNSPQSSGLYYHAQPQNAAPQPQQSAGQYSAAQPQPAMPYNHQNDDVNLETGGSDYGGSAQNYGFHCKYSYGPHGKLEQCKEEPPLPNPQYGASVSHNPVPSQTAYQGQAVDNKNTKTYVSPYSTNSNVAPYSTNSNVDPYSTNSNVNSYNTNSNVDPYSTNSNVNSYSTNSNVDPYSTNSNVNSYNTNSNVDPYSTNSNVDPYSTNSNVDPYSTNSNVDPYSTKSSNSYVDPHNTNSHVDPHSNENYVYVPAPWD